MGLPFFKFQKYVMAVIDIFVVLMMFDNDAPRCTIHLIISFMAIIMLETHTH
jgi:hypothetical protein